MANVTALQRFDLQFSLREQGGWPPFSRLQWGVDDRSAPVVVPTSDGVDHYFVTMLLFPPQAGVDNGCREYYSYFKQGGPIGRRPLLFLPIARWMTPLLPCRYSHPKQGG